MFRNKKGRETQAGTKVDTGGTRALLGGRILSIRQTDCFESALVDKGNNREGETKKRRGPTRGDRYRRREKKRHHHREATILKSWVGRGKFQLSKHIKRRKSE